MVPHGSVGGTETCIDIHKDLNMLATNMMEKPPIDKKVKVSNNYIIQVYT